MIRTDVIVIGGGLSGWIAAVCAAKGGKRVVLVEKAKRFGGRARSVRRGDVQLNLGAHAAYTAGELVRTLGDLGIRVTGGAPDPNGYGSWGGGLYKLPASPRSLLASPLLSLRGKFELARLMVRIRTIDGCLPEEPLGVWAESHIREPMVRNFFYALARTTTYVYDPDHQVAGPVLRQLKHVLMGKTV